MTDNIKCPYLGGIHDTTPPPSPSPLWTHAPSPGSKALAQQQVQQQPLFSFSRVPGVFVFLFPPLSLIKGRPVRCLGV